MSESTSTEGQSNINDSTINEQPRKYIRGKNDISTGVTTRARQREQDQKNKESESETMPTDQPTLNTVSSVEQCAICMENFTQQEVGIPENCEHSFCLACIVEWAKKNNSCPIDRITFRRIFKKHSYTSPKPYDTMKVQDNRLEIQLEDDFLGMIDDDISCRVCGRDDQEDLLLICDECGNGYHTYCLELPGVPETPEWMCPLCEVDQLSADENLYDDSDLEELQHILDDDTLNTTDTEPNDTTTAVRQPRVRQTARMRTGGVRNRRARPSSARPRRSQGRRRRIPATTRQPTLRQQQQQRQRRQRRVLHNVNRRIENVNVITRDGSAASNSRAPVIRSEAPRLSIYDAEPIALEEEDPVPRPTTTTTTTTAILPPSRTIITPSEAARRIAASGIPILSRAQTEPSISRELSVRRVTPSLDRIPSRTIRPPTLSQPRLPINQLPRIQRRGGGPTRARPVPPRLPPPPPPPPPTTTAPSFLDNLLHSQERLHNLQNVRMNGPHIQIS
ncbi:unnamed protein product [Adineta steineri]|uniref:PHD and RING finger domain-containing protein 1 n=1 Tax=Adineta steineri TaxID=433720 RepID=A0A818WBM5_9BILA|nr:unnamed protein product [Adineta steineri]